MTYHERLAYMCQLKKRIINRKNKDLPIGAMVNELKDLYRSMGFQLHTLIIELQDLGIYE